MMGRKVPKWILHYDTVSYIILAIDCVCAICYLCFLAVCISDRKLYLPFEPSKEWLELNSYSILPPFCCIPLVTFLAYHIRYKTVFSDGDFYGVVGAMLGLSAISIFDGARIVQVYFYDKIWTVDRFLEAIHSGVPGIIVTDFIYTLKIMVDGKLLDLNFENGKDGTREVINGKAVFVTYPNKIVLPIGGKWTSPVLADGGIRTWTHDIQQELKCCGARSYKDWDNFSGSIYPDYQNEYYQGKHGNYPPSCYCKYTCPVFMITYEDCFDKCGSSNDTDNMEIMQTRKGCYHPYVMFLRRLYILTVVLMMSMAITYLLTICTYIVNFAALRQLASLKAKDDLEASRQFSDFSIDVDSSYALEPSEIDGDASIVGPYKRMYSDERKGLVGRNVGGNWQPKLKLIHSGSYHQFVWNAQPNSKPRRRRAVYNLLETKSKSRLNNHRWGKSAGSKNQVAVEKKPKPPLQEMFRTRGDRSAETKVKAK